MDLGLAGRVALVTASSKGLGRAAAVSLAREGCRTVICARGEAALRATEAEISDAGGEVHAIVADVTEADAPQRLVDEAVDRYGTLDVLVANAGGPPPGAAFDPDDAAFRDAFEANALTSIRLVRAARGPMTEGGFGRICLITSITVKQPIPFLALSNTARAGLWAWAKTAAAEMFDAGITLNLACPGTHLTDRVKDLRAPGPDANIGDPADFGDVVAFLCSAQARFITGTAVSVDGGSVAGLL
jgi:3-oxoacyl-[acyl-carrier protein] reductase